LGKQEGIVKVNIENNGGRLWTRMIRFGISTGGGILRHEEVLRSGTKGGELMIVASQNGYSSVEVVTRYVVSWGGVVRLATLHAGLYCQGFESR
jgi:hypothetical protein